MGSPVANASDQVNKKLQKNQLVIQFNLVSDFGMGCKSVTFDLIASEKKSIKGFEFYKFFDDVGEFGTGLGRTGSDLFFTGEETDICLRIERSGGLIQ